jgi:asparagine synthase (glutamine-hydrolysing)
MLNVDTKTWLPDDLLIKADKITMANSVELRVPFLDHHVLEFAASLPDEYKIHAQQTKRILKKALRERLPGPLLERRKAGFPVPVDRWLSKELFGFARDVLSDPRTRRRGYVRPAAVDTLLTEHRSTGGRAAELFSLLVLELWHRQFADFPARPVYA